MYECTRMFVSDRLGLVDFAVGLVDFYLSLPQWLSVFGKIINY